MSDRQPISGTLEIEGSQYPFRGAYGPQIESGGGRLAWSAEVDGLGLLPGSGLVAYPGGYKGANARAVTYFVQDHFQGRVRLRDFEARNGAERV
ncbi:hypothetical protein GT347_24505 [Xylophilus rhododendri]|uniref:Uncharacterized protein n=1 Tax=Xylophilus rhododendri TaxID=2697032 RepID=A0A857JDM9_9BURK|nr:hypothetical protein [Xylophilus rhododendri]QHJ00869.1 hypothetical protein GT347_24505 [Xylophilus rhododendri]